MPAYFGCPAQQRRTVFAPFFIRLLAVYLPFLTVFHRFHRFLKNGWENNSHAGLLVRRTAPGSVGTLAPADARGRGSAFRAATVRERKPAKGQSATCP
jgi:hypothetical protein